MRTKNVAYGSMATAILSLVTMIAGLIIPRQIILAFGSEINGISNSITQFISYFSLLEAGLAGSAIFSLYKPIATKDQAMINGILSASKQYYNRIALLYLGSVVLFSVIFSLTQNVALSQSHLLLLSLAIGLGGVLEFSTMAKYRVLLTASQKTYVVALATSASIVVKVGVLYIALGLGSGIITIKALTGLTILVRSVILYLYVKRNFKDASFTEKPNHGALQQRGDVLLIQLLGTVQKAFPTVAMTLTGIPYTNISIYTVYMSVIIGVRSILDIFLNSSIYSTFGEVISLGQYDVLKKALDAFETICYFVISVLIGCLLVLFIPFMRIYSLGMDDANYIQTRLAYLLVFSTFIAVIRYPLSSMIQAAGHYRKTRARNITQAVIAVALSLALSKPFGMYGLLIGFLVSDLYFTVVVFHYVPNRITRTSSWVSLKRVAVTTASILVSWLSFVRFFTYNPTNYFSWFLLAAGVGLWCFAITFLFNLVFNSKEMKDLGAKGKEILYKLGILGEKKF